MQCLLQERGFTLLEVLIALLVVAVTLSAATAAVGAAARRQAGLEERTFATWAAQNTLSRLRLDGFAADAMQSEQSIAGQVWRVEVKVAAEGPLRRVDLTVRRAGAAESRVNRAEALARLTGFLPVPEQDVEPGQPSVSQPSPNASPNPQAQDRSPPEEPPPPEQDP